MRKSHLGVVLLVGLCVLFTFCYTDAVSQSAPDGEYYLLIGTYGPKDTSDIYVYKFNSHTGQATFVSAVDGVYNASFQVFSPDHRFVYSVSEANGPEGGSVYSFSFDAQKGTLKALNHQLSHGKDPCYLATDRAGNLLLVANYSSGSLSVFPLNSNGQIGEVSQVIKHHGSSINKDRQGSAHVHSAIVAPNDRDVFVADLGMDKVMTYELDHHADTLIAGNPPFIEVTPGHGPRHMAFHPNGKFLYLIQEMGGNVTGYRYQPGKLTYLQDVSIVPQGYKEASSAAIHFSPDGRFLYASNRIDLNDIVIYAVDPHTGKLTYVGKQNSGGVIPREFAITPDGNFLLAGHRGTGGIAIFKRDKQTGMITPTGANIKVPRVVCLTFAPVP